MLTRGTARESANHAMADERYRVLAIATHPVQYMAPLFRRMAAHPALDLDVAYCSLRGAQEGRDPEFGASIQWDVPLLDGYAWSEVPNRGSGKESFFGLRNPGLWKLIRDGNYDAVLCFAGYVRATFWIAWLAAKLSRAAFLFGTDAASLAPRDGQTWKVTIKKVFWPRLFRLADQVIVPSSAGAQMMRELGIPPDRITLTPFVVDNDWWLQQAKKVDRAAVRTSWRVSEEEFVVLFCAKLQDWKRPLDLLHAFAKADVPDAILVFGGAGPLHSQIEAEAVALGIASRVRLLGFTNQTLLPAAYCAADLFVLPSGYDPCPAVVCEAMLCGCPVVISDAIRGRFDLVSPGITGDIFPCGNVDALAALLKRLFSDRPALAALGANARARMETWSPRENIAATVDAVRIAVTRKPSRHFGGTPSGPAPETPESIRLNLGCGLTAPAGWINVDGSWNARLAKHPLIRRALSRLSLAPPGQLEIPWKSSVLIHNVRRPLPFPNGSASVVYASHLLEHLYHEDGRKLMAECFRVLQPGGVLRVVVPDLRAIVDEYLANGTFKDNGAGSESLRPAEQFNRRLLMRWPTPASSNLLYRVYTSWQDFHSHKWMYDEDSLIKLFAGTGFVDVERKDCHQSRIAGIQDVEDPSRIRDRAGVCVEGVKPGN